MNTKQFILLFLFFLPSINNAWTNWAGNLVCNPSKITSPSNLKELQALVKKAKENKQTIRAIGAAHSWTDILCTEGYLLNTDNLNQVLSIDFEKKQIHVQAGIKLKNLIKILAEHNLALPNQPAITEQSIAGVMSTATHGTGHTGTMADFITSVELLAADGNLYTISQQEHAEWFPAVRISVGALGIIYAVTIQCVPLFKLIKKNYHASWPTIRDTYQKLNQENDFFSFFYLVHEEFVSVDVWNRTEKPVTVQRNWKIRNATLSAVNWIDEKTSTWLPQFIQKPLNNMQATLNNIKKVEYSYDALSGKPSSPYLEEEIAIEQSILPEVIEAVKKLIVDYQKKGIMISGILSRFVQKDTESYLSPASNRNVVFVSISTPLDKKYESFYQDYFKLMLKFNGRPHWGKLNYLTFDEAKKVYGQNFDKFLAVRKQLDSDGMFSNEFTRRVFGW